MMVMTMIVEEYTIGNSRYRQSFVSWIQIYFLWLDNPSEPKDPQYWGFEITRRHTTLGRSPLDEWSARRKGLNLGAQNTHKRQDIHAPGGIRTAIPPSERPETHAFDRVTIGIGLNLNNITGI